MTGESGWFSPSWLCIRLSIALSGGVARRVTVENQVSIEELDALVISGGDDIDPSLFGIEPLPSSFYNIARDAMEQDYIRQGTTRGLPILGICRGHQLINVTFGGTLYPDIREIRVQTLNRRGLLATKTCRVKPDSRLSKILERDSIRINSLHFQAVKEIASDFESNATDLDNLCQAIAHRSKNILGVQWHPEYLFYLPRQLALFRWLIKCASERRQTSTKDRQD